MNSIMKICNFVVVLFTISGWSAYSASICSNSDCRCFPPQQPETIDCNCNYVSKNLEFSFDKFDQTHGSTLNFSVSNCNGSVIFKMNSFQQLGKLENLSLRNIKQVQFQLGVFQKLTKLELRNIQDLQFSQRAFLGVNELHSIVINHAVIPELPQYSFFDINSLQELILSDVTVQKIKKNAMKIKLHNPTGVVLFNNCTINSFEEESIILETESFHMTKSHLQDIAPVGIAINASKQILMSESEFSGYLQDNAIVLTAATVNITGNMFSKINLGLLGNIRHGEYGKILFTNNTIHEMQLMKDTEGFKVNQLEMLAINNNFISCTCSLIEDLSSRKEISYLTENNFCLSNCNVSLSDVITKVINKNLCPPDLSQYFTDDSLCEKPMTTLIPNYHTREGRHHHHHTESTTPFSTTAHPNGSDRIQFLYSVLFFNILCIVLKS